MDMTDKDNILLEDFFKQAAQQQVEDNGFTERVMLSLPDYQAEKTHRLSLLWTWFCILLGVVLFFAFGGLETRYHGGVPDGAHLAERLPYHGSDD